VFRIVIARSPLSAATGVDGFDGYLNRSAGITFSTRAVGAGISRVASSVAPPATANTQTNKIRRVIIPKTVISSLAPVPRRRALPPTDAEGT
jgi:hypothetical protein